MAEQGLRQDVLDELRYVLSRHWVRLLAGLSYTVLLAGGLWLFSAVGEDSHTFSDVHRRTTLAAVGTGVLAVGVVLCLVTLAAARAVRRQTVPGREAGVLPRGRDVVGAAVAGCVGVGLGVVALSRWS